MKAPPTPVRPVEEVLHGRRVVDPYRWLEEDSPETKAWVAAQNAHTRGWLDGWPGRERLRARFDELLSAGGVGLPVPRGSRVFYTRRDGRQDQPVLMVREGGQERVLVDPNRADAGGLVSLDWWNPSPDGSYVAYGLSRGGDEVSDLYVLDVRTGADLGEKIPRCRAASVAWLPDEKAFYYTRYPMPGTVPPAELPYHRHVWFHRLGEPWQQDREVWGHGRPATDWPHVTMSDDGQWLVVEIFQGWTRTEIMARREPDGAWIPVLQGVDALASGYVVGHELWLDTTLDAPTKRIVAVDLNRPERERWREVVPARPDATIEHFVVVGDVLAVATLESASSRLRLYGKDGTFRRELPLPELGTLAGLQGEEDGDAIYAHYSSFLRPPVAWRIELDGTIGTFAASPRPPGLDPDAYVVEQVRYPSKDGTEIPMFLLRRRDVAFDGDRPTVLTGYGGFNVARTPQYSALISAWLDQGGVYAVANLRGGGEFGEDWHRAGMLANKQNCFDDFLAAADWLVRHGVTRAQRLGIYGGSNGGLLMGAAMTQRPEAFGAVVCAVPLLDMVRYHKFRLARLWIPEYGDPDEPEAFEWIYDYSPYHHVREGVRYPPTLFETGAEDSRVDPMHAFKMAARVQAATSGGPVLLRCEEAAGHGAGKPRGKAIEEAADTWSFFSRHLMNVASAEKSE